MKSKGSDDIIKFGQSTSLSKILHRVSTFMTLACILSQSLLLVPGMAIADSRPTANALAQSKISVQKADFRSAISGAPIEEKSVAWAVDAGRAALDPHEFMARAQNLGLRPLVDLLRTRHAVQTRMQQMLARIQDVSASQQDKDFPEAAREAAWSRLVQLFEDDFWPIELRTTLTELWLSEVLQRAQKHQRPSQFNFVTWMKTSPQFLSPKEWRSWRNSRRERSSGNDAGALSTEAQILEAWETEMIASIKRGRKIKLPPWAKAFSWLRLEDQIVEITSLPHAPAAEVFLPDRRGRMEFLSSRFESFAAVGSFLNTLPSTYVPKLWWAAPCLLVDHADLSVREQLPKSLAAYHEFGEIWPVGEQRLWSRCDQLNKEEFESRAQATKAELGRLAPEPRAWSGHEYGEASQMLIASRMQSASRSWLWVGLAVLAGGLYWHQQARSANPSEPRPTHREGF